MLPALPSQTCTCCGAPLVGLRAALGEAAWGLQRPSALPSHRCICAERREGGERRLRVAFLFPWSSSAFSLQQKGMGFRRRGN